MHEFVRKIYVHVLTSVYFNFFSVEKHSDSNEKVECFSCWRRHLNQYPKHIELWKAKNSKLGQTNSVSLDKLSNQLTLCTIYIYRVKLFISCASEQNIFPLKCVQYSKPLFCTFSQNQVELHVDVVLEGKMQVWWFFLTKCELIMQYYIIFKIW